MWIPVYLIVFVTFYLDFSLFDFQTSSQHRKAV